ncbi:hypothetical protein [Marinicella gelatinilytica]|uniref:hypothetical protein n=1 Tax=Marinicella gelatinilytica TaxID=2996017 RepID=UPI0022608894|nr:hypothetical protein [Marinicella gelatinilytica]MCX7544545.1 hypothetical protein [Marinicella gelatinilytica]
MIKKILFICFIVTPFFSSAESDLALTFEANDFVGGIPVNQYGVIRFTVFNHGPDDLISSQELIKLTGYYNYMNSNIGFLSEFQSDDSDCRLAFEHNDPPPPVDNYVLKLFGGIHKDIPSQSSVTCEFTTSVPGVGISDMLWKVNLMHGITDPDMTNNTQQFTFRGLAASVPVNNLFMLMLLMAVVLVSACRYSLSKQN